MHKLLHYEYNYLDTFRIQIIHAIIGIVLQKPTLLYINQTQPVVVNLMYDSYKKLSLDSFLILNLLSSKQKITINKHTCFQIITKFQENKTKMLQIFLMNIVIKTLQQTNLLLNAEINVLVNYKTLLEKHDTYMRSVMH